MKNLILIVCLSFAFQTYSQFRVEKNFLKLKEILSSESSYKKVEENLQAYTFTFKDQFNNIISVHLNRDIDFNYLHKRINAYLDGNGYQIDLIIKGDSICLKSIQTDDFKSYSYKFLSEDELMQYVIKRNEFYKSDQKLNTLFNEIIADETFAMACGDGLSETQEGKKIKNLVRRNDIKSLKAMLNSFSCERQAFGVLGFSMLEQNKIKIPADYIALINYLKNRNSEVQICAGCLSGIVDKIY